ncbi:MAG: methyltransferase domain-containing protein, partial [Desulfobulbaceae bacterium]|nr:methyltransferase domain-containing protein [Desulfobulbaceae bacterium]
MSARKTRWQHHRARLSPFSRFVLSLTTSRLYRIRNDFAARYIRGTGYEIGAQKSPLLCKNADRVVYIDYLSREDSAQKYNIPEKDCVEVDIIADANHLDAIPSNSAAFIIANHVLEHSPNPIGTLSGWLRILRTGGVLFLTLPNYKANEFDFEKKPASIAHLVSDAERAERNEDIAREHIEEHIRIIDGIDPGNQKLFQQRYAAIVASNLHTHYHVFDRANVLALLQVMHRQTPIRVINSFSFDAGFELLFIIEKAGPDCRGPLRLGQERLF